MSDNLKPTEFIYMGRIFQVEYSNVTDMTTLKAQAITTVKLHPNNGRTFRTYILDKTRGEFSYDLDRKAEGNPEHTINLKLK